MRLQQLHRRFLLNASAQAYAQATTIAIQFLQVPLFLHFWGVEKYGEWIVLAGIPLSLAVLDFGVTQAFASKSAMEAGALDWAACRDTLATARVYAFAIGMCAVLLVVFSSLIVDWSRVLKLSQCDRLSASTVLVILSVSLAVSFQGGCLDAWMRAYGEAALSGFVAASTRLCELVVAAVLLLCGVGFVGVAGGYLASAVLVRAIHSYIALAYAPPELRHLGTFEISGVRRVMKPASGFVALSVTQAITIQGGVQVLNQLATPAQVVAFTMSRTLMRLVLNIGIVINNALRPEVSLLLGAGQRAVAERLMWKSWRFALVSGSVMYVLLVAFGPIFIAVWSGYQIHQNHLALGVIGMHALLGLVWFIPATVQMAGNAHSHYAIFYSASALLALSLWLLFAEAVEPFLGAALLLAIPELVMVLLLLGSSCREKRNVRYSFLK